MQVTVYNNLPSTWPLVSEGISVHWHGFSMNGAEWYDGVGYLAQCPIQAGTNFTYRFQVMHATCSPSEFPLGCIFMAISCVGGDAVYA